LRSGLSCQDAHRHLILENGTLVAAVADGAGSARHADRGAALAVDSAVTWLSTALLATGSWNETSCLELLRSMAREVRSRLEAACAKPDPADSPEVDTPLLADLATTLLVCFVTDSVLAACQIGDGGIVRVSDGGDAQTLIQPHRGEYINETTFVTSDGYADTASYAVQDSRDTRGIFLFTDGIQSLGMNLSDYTPFTPFFRNLEKYALSADANSDAVVSFLASERVCQRTDDDKTLVIAVRNSSGEAS
jgi:serine/threonine protein phosphatase PrpC